MDRQTEGGNHNSLRLFKKCAVIMTDCLDQLMHMITCLNLIEHE